MTDEKKSSGKRAKLAATALAPSGLLALGLSAQTSYRYLGTTLAVTQTWERFALCGVAESAILGFTTYAALTKTKFPAYLAYGVVLVQAIPAYSLSGGSGGTVRVALGPVLLAVVLHFLLGISKKVNRTRSTGLLASFGREIRERVTARLGIGRRGADSAAIARSRAADRAVRLASGRKLGKRAAARLAVAIDAAQHGLGELDAAAAEASIVARVVRRKSVADLHRLTARHVWSTSTASAAVSVIEMFEPAVEEIAVPDTTADIQAPAEPVISGWTGTRPSVRRRPRRTPRALRPARVGRVPQTAVEQPEPAPATQAPDTRPAPLAESRKRLGTKVIVPAMRAAYPDMSTDAIADALGINERTVRRHLAATDVPVGTANGTTV